MNQPEYFFVTSYGRTATVWLTHALNLHPDVMCSHGTSLVPLILLENESLTAESTISAQESAPQFCAQSFRKILADIDGQNKARWVGNIHGFSASALWLKRWTEIGVPSFRHINLLRHPITRIDSLYR